MIARLQQKAATLHLLLPLLLVVVVALSTTSAGAQMAFLPNCNFQEVSLAPCMAAGAGGGGNISGACSLLNRAVDAGHRCVCSLLLSNAVFASLVTNLLTLPLPGCFLYAPSLEQTNAPPTATSAVASTGDAARMADPPTISAAAVTPQLEKKSVGPEKADGGMSTSSNGTSEAVPRAGQSVSRSHACRRHPGNAGQGTAYALTFLTA